MFYTIRNDGQASFEDALQSISSGLTYPLAHDAARAPRLMRHDAGQTVLASGISTFFRSLGRRPDAPPPHSRSAVHPEARRKGALAATADPGGHAAAALLRQSLAERDLVVKRMVHNMSLPELSTSLMGQYWDSEHRPVLVIEVRCMRAPHVLLCGAAWRVATGVPRCRRTCGASRSRSTSTGCGGRSTR